MNAYCVSSMLSALHRWWHFILTTTIKGRGYHFSHLRELLYFSWENLSLATDSRSLTNQGKSPNWNPEMFPKANDPKHCYSRWPPPRTQCTLCRGSMSNKKKYIEWYLVCHLQKHVSRIKLEDCYLVLWTFIERCGQGTVLWFESSKVSKMGFLQFGKLSSEYETAFKNIKHYTNSNFLWYLHIQWRETNGCRHRAS